jgi:hypothetical protein
MAYGTYRTYCTYITKIIGDFQACFPFWLDIGTDDRHLVARIQLFQLYSSLRTTLPQWAVRHYYKTKNESTTNGEGTLGKIVEALTDFIKTKLGNLKEKDSPISLTKT